MANEMQRGNLTGTAIMRMPISGTVSIGGKQMKELRFMPYSEFPEEGREDVLYIDTDGNAMYYWNGTEYTALSGGGSGGTSNYNELSNKPSINDITLTGNKTSADLGLQPTISDLATIRSGAASGATAVQPSDMETALASKQDVIDDLSDIRTGAAAGETAVQPSALETALSGKQDVISDLADVRSGAAAGATAVQPSTLETALSGKQDTISDLSTIRSGASAGATAVQPSALNDYQTKLSGTNKLDPAYINYDSAHAAVTDSDKTTWSGKQDAINDLSTIRSGSEAGATAVQTIQINGTAQTKTNGVVNLPAYPTTLPASDTTSTYSSSGTAPVNGTAVAAALGTLDVASVGGSGKYISAISESNGKISATETTMDTTPTANSTVPVTSGGVAASQAAQDAEIAWNVNQGVKNLFPYGDLTGITTNFSDKPFSLQAGDYKLSFQISATTGSYAIRVKDASNNSIFYETDSNSATTKTYDMTLSVNAATITFYSSVSNNFTNIMIRPAAITDSAFQPYALPNPVITPALIKQVDEGAKNLLKNELGSGTKSGLTYTTGTDGSIVITAGTAKGGNADFVIPFTPKESGQYVLQGCPSGGSRVTYKGQIALYPSMTNVAEIFDNTSVTATLTGGTQYAYRFRVYNGKAISDSTIYPMVCSKAAWDISHQYEPYALSNPVITPALIEQVDSGAKNLLINTAVTTTAANGLTYTVNADKSVTVTGNASVYYAFTIAGSRTYANAMPLKRGTYIIKAGIAYNSSKPIFIQFGVMKSSEASISWQNIYDADKELVVDNDTTRIVYEIYNPSGSYSGYNATFYPMICTAQDWAVSQKFVPYRPSWQEMAEKTAQIGLKLVKSQTVKSNTEVTYAMNKNDFLESSPVVEGSIGTYVISVMPWSTSPNFSLYTVSYTGGSFAYTSIVKIAGADRTVTISNGVISISGFPSAGAKVSIHAML